MPGQPSPGGGADREPLSICTIAAKNYLAHARCLVDSFLDRYPSGRAFVLLVDRVDGYFDPGAERFTTIPVEDLEIPGFKALSFRYTLLELSTAVKPYLLEYLFREYGLGKLCYFDPDVLICGGLEDLAADLSEYGIVLTPHIVDFLEDGYYPDELDILQAGAFNLGFIGLSANPGLARFLSWWQRKLLRDCSASPESGLFVDQRWIDLVPGLFEGVRILRDPGYNVAYWNLNRREVVRDGQALRVNGVPLKFFHFSGFVPESIHEVSRHQNRLTLSDLPQLSEFFLEYRNALLARGYADVTRWPNAFACFDNGVAIPDAARRAYREVDPAGEHWPDPFAASRPDSFLQWLNQPAMAPAGQKLPFSRLALQIYRERADLQQAFADVLDRDREAFASWFVSAAQREHALDPALVAEWRRGAVGGPDGGGSRRRQATAVGGLSALPGRVGRLPARALRGLVLFAFHVNSATRIGPAFKRIVGRGTSLKLKRKLLEVGGRRGFKGTVPPLTLDAIEAGRPSPANRPDLPRGLNVVGYLRSENGVGEVARGTVRAMRAAGFPVAATSIAVNDHARQEDRSCDESRTGNPHRMNLLHVNADQVPAVADALGPEFFAGRHNIGFWFWETSTFPADWQASFSLFDEIWVASSFTQAALASASPVPVVRMRPCVEVVPPPRPLDRAALGIPDGRFVFLSAFDPFSISERKNPFGVVEAFRRAFGARSREAVLVLKVSRLDRVRGFEDALAIGRDYAARLQDAVDSVAGVLLDRYLDRGEMLALLAGSDALVSLHRSEGFGLMLAEAMLLGKPCIGTAYSSNMEFMNPGNSYLVDYRLIELARDFGPYRRGSVWADPDLDHAAGLLARVAQDREEAGGRGATAAAELAELYGRRLVGEAMVRRLELVQDAR